MSRRLAVWRGWPLLFKVPVVAAAFWVLVGAGLDVRWLPMFAGMATVFSGGLVGALVVAVWQESTPAGRRRWYRAQAATQLLVLNAGMVTYLLVVVPLAVNGPGPDRLGGVWFWAGLPLLLWGVLVDTRWSVRVLSGR